MIGSSEPHYPGIGPTTSDSVSIAHIPVALHDLHDSTLYPVHFELHSASKIRLLDAETKSPHQQWDPGDVAINGLLRLMHCY